MNRNRHGGNLRHCSKSAYRRICARGRNTCFRAARDYIVNYSLLRRLGGAGLCLHYGRVGRRRAVRRLRPGVFMSTGYSYLNCRILERFAEILGRDGIRAASGRETAGRGSRARCWRSGMTPQTARSLRPAPQACQAFAPVAGNHSRSRTRRARQSCVRDDLVSCDYRFTTGNL